MEILQINEQYTDFCSKFTTVLDMLFRNSPDGILYKDKNLRYITANNAYFEYHQIKDPQELIGKTYNKFLSVDALEQITQIENNILSTRKPQNFKLNLPNGRIMNITATPVIHENEFMGIFYVERDITHEENLKEKFFMNNYQLRALLENVPKLIFMKDLDGNYITGTKNAPEFINSGKDILNNITLDVKQLYEFREAEDNEIIKNNTPISYEREIFDTKGIPHWYTIYKAPINDYENDVIGIVVMIKNNDDSRLLEAQRETFVASLGHDLKNPTLAQLRAVELLLKGEFGHIPDEQREILEMVKDSCRYMNAMLASLLATYRNERGVVKLNDEEFSLVDLVMECTGEMIYMAKDKNVGISIQKNCDIPYVYGDRVQIKRVIMNLLSNGIKYAYKDSTLDMSLYNENNYTCFKFENKSPFIPLEKRESIFAQYVSYAQAHKELGIGLGLYTSQKIVEAHEGKIFVESFEDDRNIFGFKIPYKPSKPVKQRTVMF